MPSGEDSYIRLIDWTGRQLHAGKRGVVDEHAPPPLLRGLDEADWPRQVCSIESRHFRAIESAQAPPDKARSMGQQWFMARKQQMVLV